MNIDRFIEINDGLIHCSDIPGTGHFLPMSAPDAVATTILDWLDRAG